MFFSEGFGDCNAQMSLHVPGMNGLHVLHWAANILWKEGGEVNLKIVDFCLSEIRNARKSKKLKGTVQYAAHQVSVAVATLLATSFKKQTGITLSEIVTSWSPMWLKIECWAPEFQG